MRERGSQRGQTDGDDAAENVFDFKRRPVSRPDKKSDKHTHGRVLDVMSAIDICFH